MQIKIYGTGHYLPTKVVSSYDLDEKLNLTKGTSFRINKVSRRYFACEEETSTKMAIYALKEALTRAHIFENELDLIIAVSVVPEQPMPTNAVLIHRGLGSTKPMICFDINASCLGFLQAMQVASSYIAGGICKYAAVVASEVSSKGLNWDDLNTCTLFGDGAAATIIGPSDNIGKSEFINFNFETYSEGAELCRIGAGGTRWNIITPPRAHNDYLFSMDSSRLMRLVAAKLPTFINQFFTKEAIPLKEVDCVIPHQASHIGLKYLRKALNIPANKIVDILETHGNMVTVSLPLALHHAILSEKLLRGHTALLIGTGAGLTCGGLLLRF